MNTPLSTRPSPPRPLLAALATAIASCLLTSTSLAQSPAPSPKPPAPAAAAPPATLSDDATNALRAKAQRSIDNAIAFLRAKQDPATGGWAVPPKGTPAPTFPAITGLVVSGLALEPAIKPDDKALAAATNFILSYAKPDGGIYDTLLPTYNTAICLSALARLDSPKARAAIAPAQDFLRKSQWGTSEPVGVGGSGGKEAPAVVGPEHPFYGGVGYGNRGRPDLSNLAFMLQAFHDTGVPADDPAFQRAIVFMQRCQMLPTAGGKVVNDQPFAAGSKQGGFIYATAENDKTVGQGQSFAGTIEETLDDGSRVSKLACYGSITYSGFKSYLYAGLKRDDPRVTAAYDWMRRHYTLESNPGMPDGPDHRNDGYYYYIVAFARALDSAGLTVIDTLSPDNVVTLRNWRADLINRLAELQQPDGSFPKLDDRWMEDNPVLTTAYCLIALEHAVGNAK